MEPSVSPLNETIDCVSIVYMPLLSTTEIRLLLLLPNTDCLNQVVFDGFFTHFLYDGFFIRLAPSCSHLHLSIIKLLYFYFDSSLTNDLLLFDSRTSFFDSLFLLAARVLYSLELPVPFLLGHLLGIWTIVECTLTDSQTDVQWCRDFLGAQALLSLY